MKCFKYVINDEIGIHARPAGMLVKISKGITSDVTIICREKKADCKKLMMLMALGVKNGDSVIVSTEGEDEEEAIDKLEIFFKENL